MAGFFAICNDFLKPVLESKIAQCRRKKLYLMGVISIPALSWLETIPQAVNLVPRTFPKSSGR